MAKPAVSTAKAAGDINEETSPILLAGEDSPVMLAGQEEKPIFAIAAAAVALIALGVQLWTMLG